MNAELFYDESPYFEPRDIAILFSDHTNTLKMQKNGSGWFFQTDLPPGEYHYRFLVNNELSLTDPHNNLLVADEHNQPWSVLIIGSDGQRHYNSAAFYLQLKDYILQNNQIVGALSKKKPCFFIGQDKQVAAKFIFSEIEGLHTVTIAWFNPSGELFQYTENVLYETNAEASLWFWINLKDIPPDQQGLWKLQLFVDGSYLLEDFFTIAQAWSNSPPSCFGYFRTQTKFS